MSIILPYSELYEHGVQELYSIPVSGLVSLSLQRKPHTMIGANVQCLHPRLFVVLDQEKVIGLFNIGSRLHEWEGQEQLMPYFCDLRIHPSYQNGLTFLKIIRFVNELVLGLDTVPATTIVFADNSSMISMIEKRAEKQGQSPLPYYQEFANFETFIFKTTPRSWKTTPLTIRAATKADIPHIEALKNKNKINLMHHYDYHQMHKHPHYYNLTIQDYVLAWEGSNLVGAVALWRTESFKQTVVSSYHPMINWIRPIYNLIAGKLMGYPTLPKKGEQIHTNALHDIIIHKRNGEYLKPLLSYIAHHTDKPLMITFDLKDPLYHVLSSVKASIKKKGKYYLVNQSRKRTIDIEFISLDVSRI